MAGWENLKKEKKEATVEQKKKVEPVTRLDIPEMTENPFRSINEIERKRGIKLGIYGDYGTGKTHFALTAKEPVFVIDTEHGAAPLAHQFKGKDIKVVQIFKPNSTTALERDDVESFVSVKQTVDWLYNNPPEGGTIVIDSATDIWKMCQVYSKVTIFRLSPFDRLRAQFDWGTINNLYQQLIMKLLAIPANLILTARAQEVYLGPNPTGTYNPHWQKTTSFYVDTVLFNKKRVVKGETEFDTTIEKCRFTKDLIGKHYTNLTWDTLYEDIGKYVGENEKVIK